MAGRASALTTTIPINAANSIANRTFHDRKTIIEIDGVLRSIEFHVRHLPHFSPSTLEKIEIAKLPKCDR
jgi:hypothetical protein